MSATADTRAYRGETLEDALRQVREELGPEAIVVKQREGIIGGVGGFFGKRCVELEVLPEPAPEPALLPVLAAEPQPLPVQIFDPAGMQRRLTSSGLDERLAREVVAQAESELRFFDPTEPFGEQVRTVLARRIRVARAPRKSGRRVIALVGPSGSGK